MAKHIYNQPSNHYGKKALQATGKIEQSATKWCLPVAHSIEHGNHWNQTWATTNIKST